MNLDAVIAFIESGATWAGLLLPGAGPATKATGALIRIILAAKRTHEQITGEPLDLSKLHELPHVE